jgi:hypothetical protein
LLVKSFEYVKCGLQIILQVELFENMDTHNFGGYLCNLNDNSSMENAIDKKCARQIARHK